MDIKQVEDGLKVLKDDKVVANLNLEKQKHQELDAGSALQMFLDRIPVSSIPGIKNSPVVELKTGDSIKDAIQLLYDKNVSGALIAADAVDPDTTFGRSSDQYMGFIDFVSLVLWSLEECEKANVQAKENGGNGTGTGSFFTMLKQSPEISQTKVGELAKCFLWDPFFPVHLDDTLFHVLLLLSKHHRLQAVPVIDQSGFQVIGFATQNAVIQLLLQSSGLGWFDGIADKALSEFRFESEVRVVILYSNQSLAEALSMLWESRIGAVAVVNRETEKIIGCLRNSDVYLLLEHHELLNDRKSLTMREFIHMETAKDNVDPTVDQDLGAFLSAGVLRLRSSVLPRMYAPVTARRSNTLKQVMYMLTETKSSHCFLLDDSQRPTGMLTLRDIIIQFAPPCIDSSIRGGGFFESALEQTGCQVKDGTIVCDN
ncbi:AMP-activated protein kinase, gamma regulatory subunit, putative [Ricinus communis]|uniref:AMP-activated protein kinase, gamma regulatory subunit, putative n=2 Tax=Ricinus communis TaxID=3988 RepID=B9RH65_RICCO|nr:AMP-activated protein kinase, gamma regulatory subunit, putative [Ricinus communis]|eukprot:XP_002512924.1 SNF1-related protein kinase regulatory subunit gamma-1 [Ricinus communis]